MFTRATLGAVAFFAGIAGFACNRADAGVLDGTTVTFQDAYFYSYNPPGPPTGTETVYSSASGTWGGAQIAWAAWNTLSTSGDQLSVTINAGSADGMYDIIKLPDVTITDATVIEDGINRYGGTFGASRVSFDAHDVYLDINGNWNTWGYGDPPPPQGVVISLTTADPAPAPEPASLALLGAGLAVTGIARRKRP